ncbi:sigma-70 family RNA polymerase sigma factor [Pseudoduganella sp. FT26W]|uniref:Sigma-70 family RNA polymerase sigma factor n=1 Tax=Duganella aquatilis TaxID=2666082 RepID=A0A844CR12_9BURK|nr:sigma-70 family RNA polymerase sigma factor [Duganella aquatilis]MRW82693.1 sigma-70 family RNA polymerase sigma factor [Duganella aquatilis]
MNAENVDGLYSAHHGWLYSLLQRRLGNQGDAADLAHDAFIRLLVKPRSFDSFDGARAYLSTVARGLCVDLWRRREVEQAWLDALAAQPESFTCSAEHSAIVLQALTAVDAMLRKLPPNVASAFVMGIVLEMTDKQIAAELGVSDRMVRKYMAQAMLHCMQLEARWAANAA